MKLNYLSKLILLVSFGACLTVTNGRSAENGVDAFEILRASYRTDRQAFVAEALQLTESESAAFWPIYRTYRADIDKLGDGLLKLVLEYSDVYPNVPEERARQMLKEYGALDEGLAHKRAWYYKRAGKALPAVKVLRWAQVENRLDIALRLQLAGNIPLVPVSQTKP